MKQKKTKKKAQVTYKSSTGVAKCRPLVSSFMEVMCVIKVVAQLGTYRHSPDEVRGDFLTVDLSLPVQNKYNIRGRG